MEPICIGTICFELSMELGALILGAVGMAATLLHHFHEKASHEQRERHHAEAQALHARMASGPRR
jgi:hypothetical protein